MSLMISTGPIAQQSVLKIPFSLVASHSLLRFDRNGNYVGTPTLPIQVTSSESVQHYVTGVNYSDDTGGLFVTWLSVSNTPFLVDNTFMGPTFNIYVNCSPLTNYVSGQIRTAQIKISLDDNSKDDLYIDVEQSTLIGA